MSLLIRIRKPNEPPNNPVRHSLCLIIVNNYESSSKRAKCGTEVKEMREGEKKWERMDGGKTGDIERMMVLRRFSKIKTKCKVNTDFFKPIHKKPNGPAY